MPGSTVDTSYKRRPQIQVPGCDWRWTKTGRNTGYWEAVPIGGEQNPYAPDEFTQGQAAAKKYE